MIFLAYVIVFGGYLVVAALAVFYLPTRFKDRMKRFGVFVAMFSLFVLAPGGWIYYERSYFDNLCEKEGAVTIYRTAKDVEGFIGSGGSAEQLLRALPYKYIEDGDSTGFVRYTLSSGGGVTMGKIARPASRYRLDSIVTDLHVTEIAKSELRIRDIEKDEVIAVRTTFSRGHNWFRPWLSSGPCRQQSRQSDYEFIISTLNPPVRK